MRGIVVLVLLAFASQLDAKPWKHFRGFRLLGNNIEIKIDNNVYYDTPYELCLNFDKMNLNSSVDSFNLTLFTQPNHVLDPFNFVVFGKTKKSCFEVTFKLGPDADTLSEFNLTAVANVSATQAYNSTKIIKINTKQLKKLADEKAKKLAEEKMKLRHKELSEQHLHRKYGWDGNGTMNDYTKSFLHRFFHPNLYAKANESETVLKAKQKPPKMTGSDDIQDIISDLVDDGPLLIPAVPRIPKKKLPNPAKTISFTGPGSYIDYITKLLNGETINPADFPNFIPKKNYRKSNSSQPANQTNTTTSAKKSTQTAPKPINKFAKPLGEVPANLSSTVISQVSNLLSVIPGPKLAAPVPTAAAKKPESAAPLLQLTLSNSSTATTANTTSTVVTTTTVKTTPVSITPVTAPKAASVTTTATTVTTTVSTAASTTIETTKSLPETTTTKKIVPIGHTLKLAAQHILGTNAV